MNKADKTRQQLLDELQKLTSRMMEAEETLRAIRSGEVDGLVVKTAEGDRVFTLSGADHPYRIMVETMNEAAVTLASDGTILYCNQRFADIVKGSLEKAIGSSIYQYISSTDLPLFKRLVKQGLKGNSKGELALQAGGENSVPVLLSMSALQHTEMPGVMCAVMVDITELKKMEEALKNSETRYRRLFEAAQDGILILDAETGQIVEVNPFLVELLGYSHKELLGKKLWEIGTFRDIEASKATSSELKSKGYVRYHDLPLETKGGRQIAVEFVSNVYLVNHYKVIQCNIRDTTERKLAAEALKKSHNELEQQAVELRTALSEIKAMKDQFEAENIYFRQENKMKHQFEHIIGHSDGLKYVLYRAEQVAPQNTTVLILGETGTGKELIAAAIHNMSPRKERPLITVNCAALPGNLIESELFGREKGAFTGADARQVGRFEVAHGSTICLDEIGELPLELQGKLLRVIQHNEFERLGSSHTLKVDVRIVATTNRNLEEEIRNGRFRQDLYYRLNVFPITVPPLRQRKEDIPLMVQAFIERYSRKLGKQITTIHKETMEALQNYPWPGNVRELESIIERAVILCPGPVLQLADKLEISSPTLSSVLKTLEETERNQILKILSETQWRIEGKNSAAAILGLHPSTLRARMHKLGIVRPETKKPD
ncbi:MAG: sigma 54-interacting transcriptional regulator [Thermodesulfobacteriota bacterium]|jgi:PAS domain S-box-containing protein